MEILLIGIMSAQRKGHHILPLWNARHKRWDNFLFPLLSDPLDVEPTSDCLSAVSVTVGYLMVGDI